MEATKLCTQCHAEKELDQFYRHGNMYHKGEYMSMCKDCYAANTQECLRKQHEEWERRQEERRRVIEEERKLREEQRQQWEEERKLQQEERILIRKQRQEQQRIEWQQQEQQRAERRQWLVDWYNQQPDRHTYVHPNVMQLPEDEDHYPQITIDDIVKHYYRWESSYAVCEWLQYLASLDYCIVDTETTGTRRFSQVIEVTILDRQGSVIYTSLLQPTTSIEPMATSVHGLTWNDVKDTPRFSEVYRDIYPHLTGKTVLAYNASFDVHSLFRTARAFQVPFPRLQVGCLMFAYSKLTGEKCEGSMQNRRFDLAKACIREGIDFPGVQQFGDEYFRTDLHRAENDARYLYELLQCMLRNVRKDVS